MAAALLTLLATALVDELVSEALRALRAVINGERSVNSQVVRFYSVQIIFFPTAFFFGE